MLQPIDNDQVINISTVYLLLVAALYTHTLQSIFWPLHHHRELLGFCLFFKPSEEITTLIPEREDASLHGSEGGHSQTDTNKTSSDLEPEITEVWCVLEL